MATLNEITEGLTTILSTIQTMDSKLDEVKAKIDGLEVGSPVSQEQLDALAASVDEVKAAAAKVLTETDDLA